MSAKKRMPHNPLEGTNTTNDEQLDKIVYSTPRNQPGADENAKEPHAETPHAEAELMMDDLLPQAVSKPKNRNRMTKAKKVVIQRALISTAAGLIPIPLLDAAAVTGVQMEMLAALSRMYGVPLQQELGKKLLASLLGSVLPLLAAKPGASLLRFIPIIGSFTGILMVSNAAVTYAVGMTFIMHFEAGGTLLDCDPQRLRNFFKSYYAQGLDLI